jgi:hypothetical protein
MKIRLLTGPRAGQIDHAPNSQEIQLQVKLGNIEIMPYRDFRERLREEGQGGASTNVNPSLPEGKIEWGVLDRNTQFREVTVVKKFASETVYYSTPPVDAPKSIVQRFNDLSNSTRSADAAADLAAAKRAQLEYNEKLKEIPRW